MYNFIKSYIKLRAEKKYLSLEDSLFPPSIVWIGGMKTQSQLLDVDELLTLVLLQVLLDPLGQLALLHHNSRPLQLLTTFGLVLPTSLSLDTGGALVETLHHSITCQVIVK